MQILLAAFLLYSAPTVSGDRAVASQPCAMRSSDREWLDAALAKWPTIQRHYLMSPVQLKPTIVVYDASCRYVLSEASANTANAVAARYEGAVTLPNGARTPAGPNAFFTATMEGDRFLLMALPSVWTEVAPKGPIPLNWVLEGILFHELTHSYQSAVTPSAWFLALQQQGVPADRLGDDGIQDIFASNAAYAQAVEIESDLLFAAAAENQTGRARTLACAAADKMHERRRRFLASDTTLPLDRIDEISITSEGLAQWTAYRWLVAGRGVDPKTALAVMRGRFWSQDVGLALFLTLDRLMPHWQRRLFANPPVAGSILLDEACRTPGEQ